MEEKKVLFNWPDLTEEEVNEVVDTLRSGWITTGPKTKKLEKQIAEYIGSSKAVCLNSATAAEELNLRILGVGPGDEVIVPAFTYTATVSAVLHVGATPIPVDIQKDHFEMDYDSVDRAITNNTKAVVCVDLYGIPCDYEKIYEIVEKKKEIFCPSSDVQRAIGRVAIIDDAAHSIGAKRKISGKKVYAGQLADFSSFSFHSVKNITTAEGGAALWKSIPGIDNEEIYHRYMLYSLHGQSKDAFSKYNGVSWEYDVLGPWYKCNMTDILASIGIVQLRRYPEMLKRRREIIEKYDAAFKAHGIKVLDHYTDEYESSGHLYITRTPWLDITSRNEVIQKMGEQGISCNVHYKPLPMMSGYKKIGWKIEDFPNSYNYFKNLITLPLFSILRDDEVEYVIEKFLKTVQDYK
ncbi:DegT/DnrJ/EryC1/StrS family aminotransferase [Butyrivibrio sp. LC3010]|uniref:DegT/DnrJ/EryC1/StrS family aminotransferase n=1 Tax=Butyrivibrio sp. LC3010 TaxID=1280680 RepID=UPI0018CA962B